MDKDYFEIEVLELSLVDSVIAESEESEDVPYSVIKGAIDNLEGS